MGYAYQNGNCYGRGDYYRGDYYRGDPGIFGTLAKAVGGFAKGLITGGPLGAVTGAAGAILRSKVQGTALAPAAIAPPPFPSFGPIQSQVQTGGLLGIQMMGPMGGGGAVQQPVGTMTPQGFIPGCQLRGTRPNKAGYYKQIQKGNPANVVYIPKGSVCVKSRRLNVGNARALRRAIRRAQGFAKLSRRVLSFVQAKAPKGRARFRRKK